MTFWKTFGNILAGLIALATIAGIALSLSGQGPAPAGGQPQQPLATQSKRFVN